MEIIKEKTASFDVDAQKGFTPLCPNELPVKEGHHIAEALNRQAEFAIVRVGSKDAHPNGAMWEATEENPQFSEVGSKNVDIRWNKHCVVGTQGCELLDGLPAVFDYDYFVWKGIEKFLHPYSACYHTLDKKLSTGVIEFLKSKNIGTVILGGLAENFCVGYTAIDLASAGFEVIVNKKATRPIEGANEDIYNEFTKAGIIIIESLEDCLCLGE